MLRSLDDKGNVKMVTTVVAILVTLIIYIIIFFNIAGSIDTDDVDDNIRENVYGEGGTTWHNGTEYAANSTDKVLDQSATFFTIAPILAIVIIAVVIIGYVTRM